MKFNLRQKIGERIAIKIAVPIIGIMLLIFVLMFAITTVLANNMMGASGQREMQGIAEKNAAVFQGVFDSVNSNVEGIADYLYSEYDGSANYGRATVQEMDGVQFYSPLFGVACTKSTYECELVLRRIFEANVANNPAILRMGAVFEPYSFDRNIEAFSMLVQETTDGAETKTFGSYELYSKEMFYTMTKEAMAPITTPTYNQNGTDIITVTYPIIYNNELMGVLYADINLSYLSEQLQESTHQFPSQISAMISPDGSVQYSSTYNAVNEQRNVLDNFVDDREFVKEKLQEEEMFSITSVSDQMYAFVPIKVCGDVWWAATRVDVVEINAQAAKLIIFMAVLFVLALILLVTMIIILTRRSLKPIGELRQNLNLLGQGKLSEINLQYKSADELGKLADDLRRANSMLKIVIQDQDTVLASFAKGDFSAKCQAADSYVGELQGMYHAIVKVSENLSETFREIDTAANQVSAGANQVSNSSQALSQGATEQASSVEELSATVQEISQQVEINAQNATLANAETDKAGEHLQISSQKMKELMDAMNEIKQTSTEIQSIIKTIDDIAFQTNILALNAAVEAARAGAAGKGFAVVADEVRSLAGKSAEASKNTQELIQKAISSVERGNTMAIDAATVMQETVGDATKVVETMSAIAKASSAQAQAIAQVTLGLDQISAVVQTNSATAEESAAASEELSGQASLLKSLIGKFKFTSEPLQKEFIIEPEYFKQSSSDYAFYDDKYDSIN